MDGWMNAFRSREEISLLLNLLPIIVNVIFFFLLCQITIVFLAQINFVGGNFLGPAVAAWEVESGTYRGTNAMFSEEEELMPLLASHTSAPTCLVEKGCNQILRSWSFFSSKLVFNTRTLSFSTGQLLCIGSWHAC